MGKLYSPILLASSARGVALASATGSEGVSARLAWASRVSSAMCSCSRSANTATRSADDNKRARFLSLCLLFCAFLNSAATLLRSSRKARCCCCRVWISLVTLSSTLEAAARTYSSGASTMPAVWVGKDAPLEFGPSEARRFRAAGAALEEEAMATRDLGLGAEAGEEALRSITATHRTSGSQSVPPSQLLLWELLTRIAGGDRLIQVGHTWLLHVTTKQIYHIWCTTSGKYVLQLLQGKKIRCHLRKPSQTRAASRSLSSLCFAYSQIHLPRRLAPRLCLAGSSSLLG